MPSHASSSFLGHCVRIAACTAIFRLAGCSDHEPTTDARVEQLRLASETPTMSAEDSFFDGKLLVEANLGRGFGLHGNPRDGEHSGSGGSGRHRGGRSHGGMGRGESSEGTDGGSGGYGGGATFHESSLPPVALRLRLTNTSKETIEVTFVLCKSELGDFAVRPEKLALAPDQSVEPEAMTSRLGLTSAEIVLKMGLRSAGKVEQKDLVLKVTTPAAPPIEPKP